MKASTLIIVVLIALMIWFFIQRNRFKMAPPPRPTSNIGLPPGMTDLIPQPTRQSPGQIDIGYLSQVLCVSSPEVKALVAEYNSIGPNITQQPRKQTIQVRISAICPAALKSLT